MSRIVLAAATAALLTAWSVAATAQTPANACAAMSCPLDGSDVSGAASHNRIVILDHSDSMDRDDKGGSRLPVKRQPYTIARNVAKELLATAVEHDPEAQIGWLMFGHRVKSGEDGACSDVEVMRELSPSGKREVETRRFGTFFDDRAENSPKGDTPLEASLDKAFREMSGQSGSIIMVTDFDENTCSKRDPCSIFADISEKYENSGVRLTHIIAFPENPNAENAPAQALAKCTNAKYIPVNDPSEVESVVAQVNDDLKAVKPVDAEVEISFDYAPAPTIAPNYGDPKYGPTVDFSAAAGRSSVLAPAARFSHRLSPGLWEASAHLGSETTEPQCLCVSPGRDNQLSFLFHPERVAVSLVDQEGSPLRADRADPVQWRIEGLGRTQAVTGDPEQTFDLIASPDPYSVSASIGSSQRSDGETRVTVQPGLQDQTIQIQIVAAPRPTIAADIRFPSDSLFLDVAKSALIEARPIGGETAAIRIPARGGSETLDPGDYSITLILNDVEVPLGNASLADEDALNIAGDAPAAVLKITAPGASDQTRWKIVNSSNGAEYVFTGPHLQQKAPPGRYIISAMDQNQEGEVTVTVSKNDQIAQEVINLE